MGHWEQIGVENLKRRERRAKWPRWRLELYKLAGDIFVAAGWLGLVMILLWVFGLI